jgi:hypothetical protein
LDQLSSTTDRNPDSNSLQLALKKIYELHEALMISDVALSKACARAWSNGKSA